MALTTPALSSADGGRLLLANALCGGLRRPYQIGPDTRRVEASPTRTSTPSRITALEALAGRHFTAPWRAKLDAWFSGHAEFGCPRRYAWAGPSGGEKVRCCHDG